MPLTPAHAAAAWPVSRAVRRLPVDALVIGTMSPDFEYLLRLRPYGMLSHSLRGVVLFCLPVGLLVWVIYRLLVRPALVTLLPPAMGAELSASRGGPYGWAAIAIVFGALTHLAWDGFTHAHGWAVMHSAALRRELTVGPVDIPIYRVVQHASSVAGLLLIAWWIRRWVLRHPVDARRFAAGQLHRALRVVLLILGVGIAGMLLNAVRPSQEAPALMLGYAAVGAMDGVAVGLAVFGLASSLSRRHP